MELLILNNVEGVTMGEDLLGVCNVPIKKKKESEWVFYLHIELIFEIHLTLEHFR